MGDPAEPGEDQLTTIIIEGPPAGASAEAKKKYKEDFEKFKAAVEQVFLQSPLSVRTKKIENVKKGS